MKPLRLLMLSVALVPLFAGIATALDIPPKPGTSPILDQANVLSSEEEQSLSAKILGEEKQTGNQVAVLTIPSLQGASLEEYSLAVARGWGIGQKDRNSGVLLLVAVDDRRLRIEVGYGLEGALPDIRANQIIEQRITPAFRQGDYYLGISSGVDGILRAIHNEADPTLSDNSKSITANWEWVLYAIFFIPAWLGAILARSKSWWAGGVFGGIISAIVVAVIGLTMLGILSIILLPLLGLLLDFFVSRNYQKHASSGSRPSWWAGGGTLGGGSSWGGFGGGSFGGGGASGSW
jgi:uncharacterized protein